MTEICISMTLSGSQFLAYKSRYQSRKLTLSQGITVLKCYRLFPLSPATTVLSDFLLDFEECWYDNRRKEPLPLEAICYSTFVGFTLNPIPEGLPCNSRGHLKQSPPLHQSHLRWELWILECIKVMLCGSRSRVLQNVDIFNLISFSNG